MRYGGYVRWRSRIGWDYAHICQGQCCSCRVVVCNLLLSSSLVLNIYESLSWFQSILFFRKNRGCCDGMAHQYKTHQPSCMQQTQQSMSRRTLENAGNRFAIHYQPLPSSMLKSMVVMEHWLPPRTDLACSYLISHRSAEQCRTTSQVLRNDPGFRFVLTNIGS